MKKVQSIPAGTARCVFEELAHGRAVGRGTREVPQAVPAGIMSSSERRIVHMA